jgi:hypothetical protein
MRQAGDEQRVACCGRANILRRPLPAGARLPDEDKPAHTPWSTSQLLARCGKIGPHVGAVAEQTYRRDGPEAIRRIMGLTGLRNGRRSQTPG